MQRRTLFEMATAAAVLRKSVAAQTPRRAIGSGGHPESFPAMEARATVAIQPGNKRRENVYGALKAIDKDLRAKMKGKKYVVIKPNFVNTVNQLAASHADCMRGILDYLSESFKGPVV